MVQEHRMRETGQVHAAWLLFAAYVLAYADRQVIAVLVPSIQKSFHLTLIELGLVQGLAFSLFFALAGIPLGWAVDRFNRRNLLATGIGLWSLATAACGLSTTFHELLLARLAVGIGEACLLPASASLLADTFSPERRGRAIAFVQSGTPIGALIAVVGGGWLLTALDSSAILPRLGVGLENWQAVFLTLGLPGLIVAALLLRVTEPPRRTMSRSAGSEGSEGGGFLRLISAHPLGFALFVGFNVTLSMLTHVLAVWSPTILMVTYKLSPGVAGSIMGAILLGSAVSAYLVSGVASDRFTRRYPRIGRVLAPGLMMPVAIAAMAGVYFTRDVTMVSVWLGVAIFVGSFGVAASAPALQAIFPGNLRGMAMAVMAMCANLLGLGLTPLIVAFFAEAGPPGPFALQTSLAGVCVTILCAGMIAWPFLVRAFARLPNYEAREIAEVAEARAAAG